MRSLHGPALRRMGDVAWLPLPLPLQVRGFEAARAEFRRISGPVFLDALCGEWLRVEAVYREVLPKVFKVRAAGRPQHAPWARVMALHSTAPPPHRGCVGHTDGCWCHTCAPHAAVQCRRVPTSPVLCSSRLCPFLPSRRTMTLTKTASSRASAWPPCWRTWRRQRCACMHVVH